MISCDWTQILAGDLMVAAPVPDRCAGDSGSFDAAAELLLLLIELTLLTTDDTMALEDWDTWVLRATSEDDWLRAVDVDGDWVVRTVPLLVMTIWPPLLACTSWADRIGVGEWAGDRVMLLGES